MTSIDRIFADARALQALFVGADGYALAYGSHARKPRPQGSDLDLLFVGPPLQPDRLEDLVREVVALHREHGLRLDAEVAYDVKLHATAPQVSDAVALRGFVVSRAGELNVPPVVAEPRFLNSTAFKFRLILNALTTPHVFLGRNSSQYRQHRAAAERAVALLALSLLGPTEVVTVDDTAEALVSSPDGASGEDFLGYRCGPDLLAMLRRGFACLVGEGAMHPVDGERFEQAPDVRRHLLARLALDEP